MRIFNGGTPFPDFSRRDRRDQVDPGKPLSALSNMDSVSGTLGNNLGLYKNGLGRDENGLGTNKNGLGSGKNNCFYAELMNFCTDLAQNCLYLMDFYPEPGTFHMAKSRFYCKLGKKGAGISPFYGRIMVH
jgi:hypothetical protein